MATVAGTTAASSTTSSQGTQAANTNQLGKDDFLKLLITQLQHQDPMNPMEDKEFISQMAQFNSLEQMQQLNKNLTAQGDFSQLTQASGMIGKTVEAAPDDKTTVTGKVVEVRRIDSVIKVMVQGPANADGTYDPPIAVTPDKINKVDAAA